MSSNPDTGSAGPSAKPASFVKSLGSSIRKLLGSRKRHEDYPPLEAEKGFFVNEAEYRQALAQKAPGRTTLQTKDGLRITIRRNLWDARIAREVFFERPCRQRCVIPKRAVILARERLRAAGFVLRQDGIIIPACRESKASPQSRSRRSA